MIRFFVTFLVLQAALFGAELTPWAQTWFVVSWTNQLAAISAGRVTLAGRGERRFAARRPRAAPCQHGARVGVTGPVAGTADDGEPRRALCPANLRLAAAHLRRLVLRRAVAPVAGQAPHRPRHPRRA